MMLAIRSSGVVRGGSTVPAIWIWLLHKQEVSGSWNWLLHKQEVSGCLVSGVWLLHKQEKRLLYKQESWKVDWLLHKQEVSGVWISGAPTIAAYGRRRLTGLVWTGGIAAGRVVRWQYGASDMSGGSSTVLASCLEVAVRY